MPTAAQFRKLALSMPDTVEKSHFGNADFRVADKIFAGLSDKETRGTLKLTPEIQATVLGDSSFSAAAGAWGRSGWTYVDLASVDPDALRQLLEESWRIVAPKRLVAAREIGGAAKTKAPAPKKKTSAKAKASPKMQPSKKQPSKKKPSKKKPSKPRTS
jgi:hypothetical protein